MKPLVHVLISLLVSFPVAFIAAWALDFPENSLWGGIFLGFLAGWATAPISDFLQKKMFSHRSPKKHHKDPYRGTVRSIHSSRIP